MKKALIVSLLPLVGSITQPAPAAEAEAFDFLINFDNCKAAFAPLYLAEDAVKVADGDPVVFGCTRVSGNMECLLVSPGEESRQTYPVKIDVPPNLAFGAENGSDFISVNTVTHAAVLSTRIATTDMLGNKICHGLFATTSEMEAMNETEESGGE